MNNNPKTVLKADSDTEINDLFKKTHLLHLPVIDKFFHHARALPKLMEMRIDHKWAEPPSGNHIDPCHGVDTDNEIDSHALFADRMTVTLVAQLGSAFELSVE